jgi:ubiquinone/menaquinone biosynthesis C-methylase UbiE
MNTINESNWYKIWNKKKLDKLEINNLEDLIKINGFDTGVGGYSVKEWLLMISSFVKIMNLKSNDDIYEIGCGAGTFLYSIKKIIDVNCYGIDYSSSLINLAKTLLKDSQFAVSEAKSLPSFNKKFDIVFAHSVFHYFPNHNYVLEVIKQSNKLLKSGGRFCLLDLNDKKYERESIQMRMNSFCNDEEYKKFYKGLNHLFICKENLELNLIKLGFRDIKFFDIGVKGDYIRQYRFNVMAKK